MVLNHNKQYPLPPAPGAADQMIMDLDATRYGPWQVTKRTDESCAKLADRHYTRQTPFSPHFTRPGKRNLVLRTLEGDAVWVTYEATYRRDGLSAWENTLFRNESRYLSSDLVQWAIFATLCEWGLALPADGFITYVRNDAIQGSNPGCNYQHAGFKKIGMNKSKELSLFQLKLDSGFLPLQEVFAQQRLEFCQMQMEAAIEEGDVNEALWFYKAAKDEEAFLLSTKNAIQRAKKMKISYFTPCVDHIEFLSFFSSDGWIPCEMMEFVEEYLR